MFVYRVIIWVMAILNHIDTKAILHGYIEPNHVKNKNTIKYPYPTSIKKCEILILDTQIV